MTPITVDERLAKLVADTSPGLLPSVLKGELLIAWAEVERITASHKALMANADQRYDELHAQALELQRELAQLNHIRNLGSMFEPPAGEGSA